MRGGRRIAGALAVAGLWAVAGGPVPPDAAASTSASGCVDSVPEPGSAAPVAICWTMYRPAGATAEAPVPMVFHSHGWGGARESRPDAFGDWLDAGFGVLSFDQRGFGDSGGLSHIEDPDLEGQDVQRLVDLVATMDWVAKDGPDDPVLGAIGGSYGGGYQFVGALTELRDRGATRFDVLAPEITWWDLRESLAPNGVVRTVWTLLLYVAGLPSAAHTPLVTAALLEGVVTGQLPASLSNFLANNGPSWHVAQGRALDIPVLFGQGITDNLFPLDQGLQNFQRALTPAARARSIFVGYNGGHVLPSLLPAAISDGGDPCSDQLTGGEGFGELSIRFFAEELKGQPATLPGRGAYHLATPDGDCVTVDSTAPDTAVPIGDVLTTVAVGLPVAHPVARGPITVAGTPTIDAVVTSLALDGRAFLGLSVGRDPLSARVIGNNLLPYHEPLPIVAEPRTIRLPSMAVDVPAGQTLYVTVSALSDMSIGHGSRVPGLVSLDRVVVNLPVVEAAGGPPVTTPPPTTTAPTTPSTGPTVTTGPAAESGSDATTTGRGTRPTGTTTTSAPPTLVPPVDDGRTDPGSDDDATGPLTPGGTDDGDGVPVPLLVLATATLLAAGAIAAATRARRA